MLCDVCNKRKAVIYYTEIVNGAKKEQHLCEECAASTGMFAENPLTGKSLSLGNLLSGMLGSYAKGIAKPQPETAVCGHCGMTASEFLEKGRFGCADCYLSFANFLDNNFKAIQGATAHSGKQPARARSLEEIRKPQLSKADELSLKLQDAIEREDFEEAAKLRDEIRAMKVSEN